MRWFIVALAALMGTWLGAVVGCAEGSSETDCPIGTEGCECKESGACADGLSCLSNVCVDTGGTGGIGGIGGAGGNSTGLGANGSGGNNCAAGCRGVDVVFALDGSLSMSAEINALAAQQAFEEVVTALAGINCGNIDYRVGVTGDNDNGWRVPAGWGAPNPWFESTGMDVAQIATAFNESARTLLGSTGTSVGCEHVLSSAVDLLAGDTTGFVRADAILVLVLVTDVDDYGAYDQVGGNTCGAGCSTPPPDLQGLYDTLVGLKAGDPAGVAAIVIAGDPAINGGTNMCGQPASCCGALGCDVFHADRLWQFAGLQIGNNGYTSNLCDGPQTIPTVVRDAFSGAIDLACQVFEPPR
jgi:hypothetical protein